MFKSIAISQIYVLDHKKALDFYVGKLGLEVNKDVDLGFRRWVTVSIPGDKTREILLELPGPPAMDDKTAEQVRDLLTKGSAGGQLVFTTEDCRKTYEALRARGVEFTMEPTERPYGIDCGLRDPFGNLIRFSETTSKAVGVRAGVHKSQIRSKARGGRWIAMATQTDEEAGREDHAHEDRR